MTKQRETLPLCTLTFASPTAREEGSLSSRILTLPRLLLLPRRHAVFTVKKRDNTKYKIKEISLGKRNDQWNCCFCGAAAGSCGISMNSPLWISRENQHCCVIKIKLFRCEFTTLLRHKKLLTATSEHILFFFPSQNCGRKTVYWSLLRNQMLL